MSGASIHIGLSGLDGIADRMDRLAGLDRGMVLDAIGSVVESQIRRRISEDKESPDGDAWPAWSDRYAKTRHAGHSLLEGEGDLLDSIGYVVAVDGSEVEIGSNLIYATSHQFGDDDRNIPAREYLGLSPDDEAEVEQIVMDWIMEVMA